MFNKINVARVLGELVSPADIYTIDDLISAESIIDLTIPVPVEQCDIEMLKTYWKMGARKYSDLMVVIKRLVSAGVEITPENDWDSYILKYLLETTGNVIAFDILQSRSKINLTLDTIIKHRLPDRCLEKFDGYKTISHNEIMAIKESYGYIPYPVYKGLCLAYSGYYTESVLNVMAQIGLRPETAIQWMKSPKYIIEYFKFLELNTEPVDKKYVIAAEYLDNYDFLEAVGVPKEKIYEIFVNRLLSKKLTKYNDTILQDEMLTMLKQKSPYNYIRVCEILAENYNVTHVYKENFCQKMLCPAYIYKHSVIDRRPLRSVLDELKRIPEEEIPYKYVNNFTFTYKLKFNPDDFIRQKATNIQYYMRGLPQLLVSQYMTAEYFATLTENLSSQDVAKELLKQVVKIIPEILLYALECTEKTAELIKMYTNTIAHHPFMFIKYIDLIDTNVFKKICSIMTTAGNHRINYRANLRSYAFTDVDIITSGDNNFALTLYK